MPAYNAFNNPWNVAPYGPYYNMGNVMPYFGAQSPTQSVPYGQSVSTQQPPTQPQFSNVWFNGGENEARMFPVAPNNAVALWSETEPVIYVKKADMAGKPSFIIYDLVERGAAPAEEQNPKEPVPVQKFATEEDMKVLMEAVSTLNATISKLQSSYDKTFEKMSSEIQTMKDDVYGIAGKKKANTRKEVMEEDG